MQPHSSEKLQKARDHIRRNACGEGKPLLHMACPVGWLNDPNGLSVYRGEVHLFYQHYPYAPHWGDMHWGHCKTRDFIHWEHLPVALAPDMPYDGGGCFSGSALEADGRHVLMYTGIAREAGYAYEQNQCIAFGNGVDYEKSGANPVILASALPPECNPADFRDPRIWAEDGVFFAVVGSKTPDDIGQAVLFASDDLQAWRFVSILAKGGPGRGRMWECPDFFALDGSHVLLVSPQHVQADGYALHNGNCTLARIGRFDRETGRLAGDAEHAVDYGLDFYAPQTVQTPDGRRVMIGWLQSWDNTLTPEGRPWSGIMSIPRELSLRDGRLCQWPVRELEACRQGRVSHRVRVEDGGTPLEGMAGRVFDMELALEGRECEAFEIRFAADERHHTSIQILPREGRITFDRTYCGLYRDVVCARSMLIPAGEGSIRLRLLADVGTAELFVNGGTHALSALVPTDVSAGGIYFAAKGRADVSVDFYTLRPRDLA